MVHFIRLSGVVSEPDKICDELLMAVFASDFSQSNAFQGSVSSFQHLVHACGGNFLNLKTAMESMFDQIFKRYFAVANTEVDVTPIEGDEAKMSISLSATLTTSAGQQLDFASSVLTADGIATQILVGERLLWTN